MPEYNLTNQNSALLRKVLDCIDCEFEDAPTKPRGMSLAQYRSTFRSVYRKLRDPSPDFDESDRRLLRTMINPYVKYYPDLFDEPIPTGESQALRELYSTLS